MSGSPIGQNFRSRPDSASGAAPTDEFFVGYLPNVPRGIRARALAALAGIFVAGGAMAVIGAVLQRDPGTGQWQEVRTTVNGVFRALPYPNVVVSDGADERSLLLVCEGKHAPGAQTWCGPIPEGLTAPSRPLGAIFDPRSIDGKRVSVTGRELRRLDAAAGTITALELGSEHAVLRVDGAAAEPPAPSPPGRRVTLEGEVVDPKCFLGAMKPGDGRVHRACAWLCIKGGIPPVLVTTDATGISCVVLATGTGEAANEQVVDLAGDRVRAEGELVHQQGLTLLRITKISRVP